ncbi:MAG: protein BmrU [Pirellulaceae bacterium]|nr:protein BmrU [Pirellulaceae bacterium]
MVDSKSDSDPNPASPHDSRAGETTDSTGVASGTSTRQVDQVIVVSSPKAGSGANREQLPLLLEQLESAGIATVSTTAIGELKQRLARAQSEHRAPPVVVAAGGDGTLALVADNVSPSVPLVPMPFGTENLLARYFGHTPMATQVHQTITQGASYRLDAGRANGQLFLVMASCGFDAEVVRALHLKRSGHISRFSYARPILRAIGRYKFPVITIDIQDDGPAQSNSCRSISCRWAMAFNLPRYGGGLGVEPGAIGNDGQLDVIAFEKGSLVSAARYILGIARGRHVRFKDVIRRKAQRIEISSDVRIPYQLDGDYVGRLPLKIETLPGRVHLLLPPAANRVGN